MKKHTHLLFIYLSYLISSFLIFPTVASAYDIQIAWDSNTEPDLESYKLYSRIGNPCPPYNHIDTYSEDELADPLSPMVEVTNLENDLKYHLVVTAYDTNGNESDYSNIVWVKNGEWGNAQCIVGDSAGGGGSCFIKGAEADFSPKALWGLLGLLSLLALLNFLPFYLRSPKHN